MDEVLYQLCRHAVGIMDGWHPYPAWAIAKQAGVSLSTARRRLRKLKEKGLARTFFENADEDSEYSLPYHGWGITALTKETDEYKKANQEEIEICRKVWGEDMFPDDTHAELNQQPPSLNQRPPGYEVNDNFDCILY